MSFIEGLQSISRRAARIIGPFLLLSPFAAASVAKQDEVRQMDLYISHPLSVLMTQNIKVRFSAYNRTHMKQSFAGEVADETGNLIVTGDWRLSLDEVKKGDVVSTRDLRPKKQPPASMVELEARGHTDWQAGIPLKQLVGHAGIYRFRFEPQRVPNHGQAFPCCERGRNTGRYFSDLRSGQGPLLHRGTNQRKVHDDEPQRGRIPL